MAETKEELKSLLMRVKGESEKVGLKLSTQKNPPANAEDTRDISSISGWERFPGEGNGYPLQYSCLGNPMDKGAWWATVHGIAKSQKRLRTHTHICKTIHFDKVM